MKKINKWETTGLLKGLSDCYKEILTEVLEEGYQYMKKETKKDSDFYGIYFPVVRRLFDKSGLKADYHKVKELYYRTKCKNIDSEIERAIYLTERYIEEFG